MGNYNYYLTSSVISWAAAQIIKTFINLIRIKKFSFERLFGPGGMPSSHSAFVTGAAISVLRVKGFSSIEFAIIAVIAMVVMYDAVSVRRNAGYHAQQLNRINSTINIKENMRLKELLGHTPLQVICGALLGAVIAFLVPIEI